MDLSKAFNCLPHDILIYKLSTYGLSDYATKLLLSYLSNRKQQIKIGNIVSTWANIQKDVPQGSILPNSYYLVKIWRMKRKGVVVCIVV
jgi:hypothetical protein